MRTDFTLSQLADPDIAAANGILRACVHCGFCTATCPTYVLTGDERDGPRGRIWLIKDMLEAEGRAPEEAPKVVDPAVAYHVDRCLSCLSCMTTCPSGVDYGRLVDIARQRIEAHHPRSWADRTFRRLLARILPDPTLLRPLLVLGWLVRPLARILPGRLGALGRMVPAHLPDRAGHLTPGVHQAVGRPARLRVALIPGCVQQVLGAGTNAAIVRLLTRLGAEVVIPPAATCCGALPRHMGDDARARALAAPTLDALVAAGPLDAVVIAASGCGASVKDWDHLFAADPERAASARRFARFARDVTEVVAELGLGPVASDAVPAGLTVAYHDSCSLSHGQKITSGPRALLTAAGFTVRNPAEGHLCCGSAGTYNMLQPELAASLQARKAANLKATGASLVAAGNLGCITQIAGALDLPVVHTAELLDWATGGPRPAGIV